MPRPTTKTGILSESRKEHEALEHLLAALSPEGMTQPGLVGEWSAKDVLAHLTEWEQMVLGWYATGLRGETPALPAEGYKWSQLPALNQHIHEKHRDRPLADVLEGFRASYDQIMALVESLSEEELFTPGRYAWARTNALASYIVSCTSSHYHWARTELRKGLRAREGQT
jgi:uncharacterized protein (TIGR03083 family)